MNFGRSVLAATAGILLLLSATSQAIAATLLYNDFVSPNWAAALSGFGIAPTPVIDDADFVAKLNPATVDLAIVQFDQSAHSSAVRDAVANYIAMGGRVIFSSMVDPQFDSIFRVTQAGSGDFADFSTTINIGGALSSGLSSSLLAVRDEPSLATFYRSFSLLSGATGLATFEDGNSAIVLANSGRTIINGFGGSTIYADFNINNLSPADEIRLYQNELGLLGITPGTPVPEPATGALVGLGLLVTAALGYRRRK